MGELGPEVASAHTDIVNDLFSMLFCFERFCIRSMILKDSSWNPEKWFA